MTLHVSDHSVGRRPFQRDVSVTTIRSGGMFMDLSLLNRGCRDESKGCTTFFTDICAVCLDDVWSLTPFNRPTFMSFLTTRTFPGLFTLFLKAV